MTGNLLQKHILDLNENVDVDTHTDKRVEVFPKETSSIASV